MKQLASNQPLCYLLPHSEIVTSLPYVDQEHPELKTTIQYLIHAQQQEMPFTEEHYLADIKAPDTPFVNSQQFGREVARIQARTGKKPKSSPYEGIDVVALAKGSKLSEEDSHKLDKAIVNFQHNIIKEINLQLYQKLAPHVQKELIAALDNKKRTLQQQIEQERQAIERINKERQYHQLEAREREQTVKDRLKVMVNKKIRIQ